MYFLFLFLIFCYCIYSKCFGKFIKTNTPEEEHAAILQAATRRKLSSRSTKLNHIPRPAKPVKSAAMINYKIKL